MHILVCSASHRRRAAASHAAGAGPRWVREGNGGMGSRGEALSELFQFLRPLSRPAGPCTANTEWGGMRFIIICRAPRPRGLRVLRLGTVLSTSSVSSRMSGFLFTSVTFLFFFFTSEQDGELDVATYVEWYVRTWGGYPRPALARHVPNKGVGWPCQAWRSAR